MSQKKVELRKLEKKNREKIKRKEKLKKALAIFITCVVILGILALTIGPKIYKKIPKYVDASKLDKVIEKSFENSDYYDDLPASGTDASEETEE